MPTTPLAYYKVAAVNERFEPLVGVEIEAMNLTTLNPDQVQETGDDGIATFTALPAGPHFFKVRATRVSTKVGGRTYTGVIHIQIVSIGGSGIVKHFIVDANGFGTHTTIQAAVTAAIALGSSQEVVIYINPGTYTERISCPFAATGSEFYFVAEGTISEWKDGGYNSVVYIASPVTGSGATFDFEGVGAVSMHGIHVGAGSGDSPMRLGDAVGDAIAFDAVDCYFQAGAATPIFLGASGSVDSFRMLNCLASGGLMFPSLNVNIRLEHCRINCAGLVNGDWGELHIESCRLLPNSQLDAAEYFIEETALVISQSLRIVDCYYSGTNGAGMVKFGQNNATSKICVISSNEIHVGTGDTGIWLLGIKGVVVSGNVIEGQSDSDGGTAIRISTGNVDASANVVSGNSIINIQNGLVVDGGATDGTCVFGPNAYEDVGTPTSGVPAAEDYEVSVSDLDHTLLDGDLHTDTLSGVVVDGDVIIGNVTPLWSRLAISIPAANVRNVFGIDNAELRPSWKTALDVTNPADVAAAASPGTSLVFSHRDHVHALGAGAVGAIDHNSLSNLAVGDVHTQYALLAGRSGGQTLYGSTVASEGLNLRSTSDATKGYITFEDANFSVGIVASNPVINFDAGDYLGYDRTGNSFLVYIGGAARFYIGASAANFTVDVQIDNRLALGTSILPQVVLNVGGTVTGFGMYLGALVIDPADGDSAWGGYFGGTVVATAAETVPAAYALYVEAQVKSGTGTITTAYGLRIIAPTIGTTNYGAYISGQTHLAGDLDVRGGLVSTVRLSAGSARIGLIGTGGAILLEDSASATIWDMRNSGGTIYLGRTGTAFDFILNSTGLALSGAIQIGGALNHDGSTVGFFGTAPAVQAAAYTPTNVTPDRAYDANATTLDEIADVLGTLVADLQTYGLLQ